MLVAGFRNQIEAEQECTPAYIIGTFSSLTFFNHQGWIQGGGWGGGGGGGGSKPENPFKNDLVFKW